MCRRIFSEAELSCRIKSPAVTSGDGLCTLRKLSGIMIATASTLTLIIGSVFLGAYFGKDKVEPFSPKGAIALGVLLPGCFLLYLVAFKCYGYSLKVSCNRNGEGDPLISPMST